VLSRMVLSLLSVVKIEQVVDADAAHTVVVTAVFVFVIVNKNMPAKTVKEDIRPFLIDAQFTYEDFAKQSSSTGFMTFRVQDYSWEEHGYSLANELYDEIAELLEDKFQTTQNLTYYTCVESTSHCITYISLFNILHKDHISSVFAVTTYMTSSGLNVCVLSMGSNKDIDTTAFRQAIWHYVHCIYGVRHDDYNYTVINDLLEKNIRFFIKLISCFPENTTRNDYRHFMTEFMQSEKVSNVTTIVV